MTDSTGHSVIVRDSGFLAEDWDGDIAPLDAVVAGNATALDLPADADPAVLAPYLDRIALIRVGFGSFADGRGFTLAARLRRMGYTGRLRAAGHVIADQYAMARRSGFDEVEISADVAARQPEDQWRARADWRAHDYQSRLRA
ncbi:DUF934 domain-containing protein [Meridianimarinicoccus sp. RP-17]|uniref:DUF934 domain-containing protein n=1 Tax=Meridianimarinicoccus zhengii TaxID=2056810 RepID=UPI000DAEFF96|nr:DUF934 domain-containing protein [Phycocomes zhengii]